MFRLGGREEGRVVWQAYSISLTSPLFLTMLGVDYYRAASLHLCWEHLASLGPPLSAPELSESKHIKFEGGHTGNIAINQCGRDS